MPGSMSDYLELAIADYILSAAAFTPPDPVYIGLFTAMPADDGTGGTEASGGSYARVSVTNDATSWPSASSPKTNGTDIIFTTFTGSIGTVVGWGMWDALTSGNLLFYGDLVEAQKAFTADVADLITCPAHGYAAGDQVRFEGVNGTLPTGLSYGTTYFVIASGLATDAFKVSTTSGGSSVDITASGAGIVARLSPRTFGNGDIAKFLTGSLKIYWF